MARRSIVQRIALEGGDDIKKELESLGKVGREAFRALQAAADDLKGPSNKFIQGLRDAERQLKSIGENVQRFGRGARNVGRDLSLYVTAPIVGAGAAVLKLAGDFQAAMNRVQAVSGASADQLTRLRDVAQDLGIRTQFSATQAAEGIEVLLKNGLTATQVLEGAVDATLKLAAAAGGELAPSADVLTDIIVNFKLQGQQLAGAVDNISGTLVASKLDIEDYITAVGQAAGVAGPLGLSFEDLNTALAATSQSFDSGTEAGTSFKTFLLKLVDAQATFNKELGVGNTRFFDARGNIKSLADITQVLRDQLRGLSRERQVDILSKAFGTRSVRTALALMDRGAAGIRDIADAIGKVSAQEQAEARLKGFNGQLVQLRSAVEGLAIAVGDSGFLDFATDATEKLTEFVRELAKTDPELLGMITNFAGVAAVIGPVIYGFGQLTTGIGLFIFSLGQIAGALAAIGTVGAAIFNPLTLGLLALGAAGLGVVGIFELLDETGDLARESAIAHAEGMARLDEAIAAVAAGVPGAQEQLDKLTESELAGAEAAVEHAKAQLAAAEAGRQRALEISRSLGNEPIENTGLAGVEAARAAVEQTERELDALRAKINGTSDAAVDAINQTGRAAQSAGEGTVRVFRGGREQIQQFGAEAVRVFRGGVQSANDMNRATQQIGDGLGERVTPNLIRVRDVINETGDGFTRTIERTGQAAQTLEGTGESVADSLRKIGEAGEAAGSEAGEGVRIIGTDLDALNEKFQEAARQAAEEGPFAPIRMQADEAHEGFTIIQTDLDALSAGIQVAAGGVRGAFDGVAESIEAEFAGLPELAVPLDGLAVNLQQAFAGVTSGIEVEFRGLENDVRAVIASLKAELAALKTAIAAAKAAAGGARAGGEPQGFAGGGPIWGAGTGTSDSILLRGSRGEFMQPSRAVRYYGLRFMRMVQKLQLPRFAEGGLIGALAPSPVSASGAAVSALSGQNNLRPVQLFLPGGDSIDGLFADEPAVDQLISFARTSRLTNTGKPTFYRR